MSGTAGREPGSLAARGRRRILLALALGVSCELCAIGLLATGAWLLLSAALRPPVLLLSVAIGAVQVFALARGAARYGERLASHDLGLRFEARLRVWLYRQLERLVPAGLPGGDRGDLLARLIADTEDAQDLIAGVAVPIVAAGAAWLAATLAATALLPPAGAVLLAAGLLGASGVMAAVVLVGRRAAALPAARGAVSAWALQALTSAEELVVLGAQDWAAAQLAERENWLGARTRAVATATGLGRGAAALAGGAGLAGVAWEGSLAFRAGRIGPVELGVLAFLALGVTALVQGLPDALGRLPVTRASLRHLAELGVLADPVAVSPRSTLATLGACGRASYAPTSVTIALRGASVAYPNDGAESSQPVVSDVDLELVPGRPVALVGPSGSGKSALVLALLRFVDLAAGQLTINGTDARNVAPERIRALLAWSPEQPKLFPASVRANLRLGAPEATDVQITRLLTDLGLEQWMEQLEAGLDTVLAAWGHPVSGGELQRLSVCRALLSDRPVLLLDEPASHLDAAAADAVLATALDRARHRSLLWVTHRRTDLRMFPGAVDLS